MKNNHTKIINLGCRLNIYEGEIIKSFVKNAGLLDHVIINSCSVTEEAEKKVHYEIRKSKRNFPNKKIIVTGCAAQIDPQKFSKIENVDFVIGNNEKMNPKTWLALKSADRIQVKNIFNVQNIQNNIIQKFEGKSRAFVEIQQGCDHRCTFCVIPFGRGNNRSVPVGVIIDKINLLVANGYNEIVLTGVDITDYGKDLPGKPNLFQLVRRIFNLVKNLRRLRLSSIDCSEINDDFWPLLSDHRLMPHFHLSLQSGNDIILKRMKRRHNRQQAINFCNKVRSLRNDVVFGADIIAGFPTETDKMFEDSIKLIDECQLTHLHIFPYSIRNLTAAAKMPQISKNIIKKRSKILREKGNDQLKKYLKKQIGKKTSMLVEQQKNNFSLGKTQHYTKISVNSSIPEGTIVNCKITEFKEGILYSSLV